MTKDDYLLLVHDMMRKRDALNVAIPAMWTAIESGALSDPAEQKADPAELTESQMDAVNRAVDLTQEGKPAEEGE